MLPPFMLDGVSTSDAHGAPPTASSASGSPDVPEPIAVVGFALKFPQDATSPEAFWQTLLDGRSAMTEVPKDRWNIDAFYHENPDRLDAMNARGGHFLKDDIAAFDAPFFSLPPAEVKAMDPQHRSLLECTYHALENAGVPMAKAIGSKTAVYVGSFAREYEAVVGRDPQMPAKYTAVGNGTSMLANRLSWFYDLRGPSVSLDTACSSSLVAFHLAAQTLRAGESHMGLVAGCNLILNPETNSIPLSNMGFLSPDSRCYSFDHRANGYARGEGTAVIAIKLLSQALKDNDLIRAVVRGTGVNQDGRTPGITQPSRDAQETLIRETYLSAGLDFNETGFFEAHGTGTRLGDPIEAGAIAAVFKERRTTPIVVGAVKSNIGHLEGAAGLAGLIKTILILEKAIIPRNIWFEKPNPDIPADEWKIKFPTETMPWPTDGLRRASVNSFGFGGVNAHLIADDAYHYLKAHGLHGRHCSVASPPRSDLERCQPDDALIRSEVDGSHGTLSNGSSAVPRSRLFVWSTADESGLNRMAAKYAEYLQRVPDDAHAQKFLECLAYTLSHRRSHLPWRAFSVAPSVEELQNSLTAGLLSKPIRSSSIHPTLAFIFTGQGAQWYAMGRELLIYPTFRKSLESAEKYLELLGCEWRLIDELHRDKELSSVNRAQYGQPMCTALQVALVELLSEWNLLPTAVVGHSSGEIAAAYCAGGLSRESAWKVAYFRGALAALLAESKQRDGSMIAVGLSESDIQPYLGEVMARFGPDRLSIGCINSPKNVTVTGDRECVDALKTLMDEQGIFARKLGVSVAYHSSHMADIASEYRSLIDDIVPRGGHSPASGRLPAMFSSVTGKHATTEQLADADYWVANMVSPVKFSDALSELCASLSSTTSNQLDGGQTRLIEIGPHAALRRPTKETLSANPTLNEFTYDTVLEQNVSAVRSTLELVGRLHCGGCAIDLLAINSPGRQESDLQLLPDLPEYPFNHAQSYWIESRLSRNFRFRERPRHELLGVPSPDWNALEAKWRNIIRMSDTPWIKDHNFNGSELYPAAGMMVMAIEAARQMANPSLKINAYRLENVTFSKALLVTSAPEGVETQLHLRPRKSNNTPSSDYHTFNLYLLSGDEWAETCRGAIITEYEDEAATGGQKGDYGVQGLQSFIEQGVKECRMPLDSQDLYDNLATFGFAFGPSFQNLRQVHYSRDKRAAATVDPRAWMAHVPDSDHVQDHVIHPAALDSMMHLSVVALSQGTWEPVPTTVPTVIQKLWISNGLLAHAENQRLQAYAHLVSRGYREVDYSIYALDSTEKTVQLIIEGYRGTAISSVDSSFTGHFGWKKLCYQLDGKPDLDLLSADRISSICNDAVTASDLLRPEAVDMWALVCLYFMSTALESNASDPFPGSTPHLAKYVEWLKYQCGRYEAETLIPTTRDQRPSLADYAYFENLIESAEEGPEKALLLEAGRNLIPILRGEVDSLQLLFQGTLVRDFYDGATMSPCYKKAATYLDLLAHKEPALNILEIGAGTGAATAAIIDRLGKPKGADRDSFPRYHRYVYTDISPGFFEGAMERFKDNLDRMSFQVLDIERDPLSQGFEAEQYDVVIASGVLHATADIDNALCNARKLLKPGGKLILVEPCNPDNVPIPFVFGLLPGWWLSTEEYRHWGPLLTLDGWDQALGRTGFNGAEIRLRDYNDHRHCGSVIISTLPAIETSPPASQRTLIITRDHSSEQHEVARKVEAELQQMGLATCQTISFRDIPSLNLKGAFCIFLGELDAPLLYDIQEEDFTILKSMLVSASGLLWLTRGRESRPELGLVTGLGRTLRSENPDLNFVELAVEQGSRTDEVTQHITKVFQTTLATPTTEQEAEYTEKDGVLCINRVIEAGQLNDILQTKVTPQKPRMQRLGEEPGRALTLVIHTPGLLDTLRFQDDEMAERELGVDEVEISVRATGVNFKDIMVALGQINSNCLGLECSGVISRVGSGVLPTQMQPGDRVCCVVGGGFKTSVRSPVAAVSKIPDHMSFNTAAALPLVYCTAYYSLIDIAHLQEGESVLIHSGAGGVGQAAIQLAKMLKAEIYTTVGNNEKKQLLMDLYRIPEDHIFVGRGASFVPALKRMTSGVDVVLNSLNGEGLRQSLGCLAGLGRFVNIAKSDAHSLETFLSSSSSLSFTYSLFDLAILTEKSTSLSGKLLTSIMTLAAEGVITAPQPLHAYKISEVEAAFRYLQGGKNTGKTVVEMHNDDLVPVLPSMKPAYYFDENASYVIAGGLGGLGRSIARWMADRRARHFILLGRSGARSAVALDFLEEMKDRGVEIAAPPCDISDEEALRSALRACAQSMPPIKGCIQGSMVLRDGLFEKMSYEDYTAATRPKAQGSWNLHMQLPENLDFFVMLSSAGGIVGTRGQSNYASGNTYQDTLARYRVSIGQKGSSLDLGLVLAVGIAAEKRETVSQFKNLGYRAIREVELHALLEQLCDPSSSSSVSSSSSSSSPLVGSQIVTGLDVSAETVLQTRGSSDGMYWMRWARRPLFSNVVRFDDLDTMTTAAAGGSTTTHNNSSGHAPETSYESLFKAAGSPTAAARHVVQGLRTKLSKTLWMPEEDIDTTMPIHRFGVDSLVAVEIRYWLAKEMRAELSIFEIMGSESLVALSGLVAQKSIYFSSS